MKKTLVLFLTILFILPLQLLAQIVDPKPDKYYLIANKRNEADLMVETPMGQLEVTAFNTSSAVFWQFVPTKKPHCYYIKNAVTGRFIGSCAKAAGEKVAMQEQPVEFYIRGLKNFVRMTSTDNNDYTGNQPKGLNKQGSNSDVIVWTAGPSNINSWWKLLPTEMLYEVCPFVTSPRLKQPEQLYHMQTSDKQFICMTSNGEIAKTNAQNSTSKWYFVGESNRKGGYQLVCANKHTPYAKGEQYLIKKNKNGTYSFTSKDTKKVFECDGDSEITFTKARSEYSKKYQVYYVPCGNKSDIYIKSAVLAGKAVRTPIRYPHQIVYNNKLTSAPAIPNSYYTLFTKVKGEIILDKDFTLQVKLSKSPQEGDELYVYTDWNRDGEFEECKHPALEKNMNISMHVPPTAKKGNTRLRLRLTNNGIEEADAETSGQVLDLILQITDNNAPYTIHAYSNDIQRGDVSIDEKTKSVIATAKDNATFVCWKEGENVVSLEPTYEYTLDHDIELKAIFSPNKEEITHIDNMNTVAKNIKINYNGNIIDVSSSKNTTSMYLYTTKGSPVKIHKGNSLNVQNLTPGLYILHVITPSEKKAKRILIS